MKDDKYSFLSSTINIIKLIFFSSNEVENSHKKLTSWFRWNPRNFITDLLETGFTSRKKKSFSYSSTYKK